MHQQAEQLYQQGQKEKETPTKLPAITFQCPSLATLQSQISEFGDVVTWKCPDYTAKKKPVVSAVKLGTGNKELQYPTGLALDETSQKVYIADLGNRCVKVLSFQGEFLTQFGQDVLRGPCGIAVTEEFIFVTDLRHPSLFQFNKDTLQPINRAGTRGRAEGELFGPRGLCVDRNGDVFIADSWNDRVSVFSGNLRFKSCIGTGILYFPVDVKLSPDTLVVLDWSPNCVRIFSRSGDLLTSCVSQGDKQNCLVYQPFFFCLDPDMNILISDWGHNTINIFTHSGELIHTLGKKGKSRGELIAPYGITVSHSGKIFIVSFNPNFTLKLKLKFIDLYTPRIHANMFSGGLQSG